VSAGEAQDSGQLETSAHRDFAAGRLQRAAGAFHALSRRYPERVDLQALIGYLALLANQPAAAATYLGNAINQGLRTRDNLAWLAEAYYRQGNLASAAYCYQGLGREGLAGTLMVMAAREPCRLADPQAAARVDWVTADPLPVVQARVNGRQANLLLDTGAGDTVLEAAFAVRAGVRLGGREMRAFAGGLPAPVTYGHAGSLALDGVDVLDPLVQVIEAPQAFRAWFPALPIHGILGSGILSRFRATLDYACGRLRLDPPALRTAADLGPAGAGAPLWLAQDMLPLTAADLPGHRDLVLFLDSGMTGGAFALTRARAEALGLQLHEDESLAGAGGGGTLQGYRARAGSLQLDRLRREHAPGVVLDAFPLQSSCGFMVHGLLGHELLRDAVLTLDFPAMRLHLEEAAGETS
jgi:hypothetical protein